MPAEIEGPSYQASKLSLSAVTAFTGVDYDYDDEEYVWTLKEEKIRESKLKSLDSHTEGTIRMIRQSKYLKHFRSESRTRTLFEILVCDRLEKLEDQAATCQLNMVPELKMEVAINEALGGGKISGRADWALSYLKQKSKIDQVLIVVEAKGPDQVESALPQLLTYLASVQDARKTSSKYNNVVFGLIMDFKAWQFAVLRENRKAYVSRPLWWPVEDKDTIIAFLDSILLDAIESSPHTTPQKVGNIRIKNFDSHLGTSYTFGNRDNPEDENEDPLEAWDVVYKDGIPLLLRSKKEKEDSQS